MFSIVKLIILEYIDKNWRNTEQEGSLWILDNDVNSMYSTKIMYTDSRGVDHEVSDTFNNS